MPLYDTECGTTFEKQIPLSGSQRNVICPKGHRAVRRVYSSPQVVFKGSGCYITDHRKAIPAGSATSK